MSSIPPSDGPVSGPEGLVDPYAPEGSGPFDVAVPGPLARATRSRGASDHVVRLAFVGAGPGDPGLLTRRAADILGGADVVVADADVPDDLLDEVAPTAERVRPAGSPVAVADSLLELVRSGRRVTRVVAGDPWSRDEVVREALLVGEQGVEFQVVAGMPHGVGVASLAGVAAGPLRTEVDARVEGDLRPDGGGRTDARRSVDWAAVASAAGTVTITTTASRAGKVASALVEHGRPGDTPVLVTCRGTRPRQRSLTCALDRVEETVAALSGRPPSSVDSASEDPPWRGESDTVVLSFGDGLAYRRELAWSEARPLFGWAVLVPRTREQAGAMSELLREYGALPVEVPTICVEKPRLPTHMERATKGLVDGEYEWVVFTSVNAVKAVSEKLREYGLDARAFSGVRIAVVGDVTAEAVRAMGIEPDLVPKGEQSSGGILEEFPPYDADLDPVNGVFLPRADIATETLVAGLDALGWQVDDVTAYRTVRAAPPPAEIREAIKGGGFDAVLFTSSSTARNLVGIAGKPHARTVVACIGPMTAQTAGDLGLRVDVVPSVANVRSLVDALAHYARTIAESGERPTAGPASRPAAKEPPLP